MHEEMVPYRIQRKRSKGWRMPDNTVYVGRPSQWGNPFHTHGDGSPMDRALAVDSFHRMLEKHGVFIAPGQAQITTIAMIREELRGKTLACWCPLVDKDGNRVPCHADVLLRLANADP